MDKKILICVCVVSILSGCASLQGHTGDHFTLSGTPEGIRSFNDGLIGALKTAKEKNSARNQYFAHRKHYEEQTTLRNAQPGFFQKLFNKGDAS